MKAAPWVCRAADGADPAAHVVSGGKDVNTNIVDMLDRIMQSQQRVEQLLQGISRSRSEADAVVSSSIRKSSRSSEVTGFRKSVSMVDVRSSEPLASGFDGLARARWSSCPAPSDHGNEDSQSAGLSSEKRMMFAPSSESEEGLGVAWPGTLQPRRYLVSSVPSLRRSTLSRMVTLITDEQQRIAALSSQFEDAEQHTDNELLKSVRMEERKCMVCDPHGAFRVTFDIMSFLALFYDITSLPIILAWDVPIRGLLWTITMMTMIFWCADLVINFRTGFYEHGNLIMSPRKIAVHYLKTWFFPDAFVLFCNAFVLIVDSLSNNDSDSQGFGLLRIAKASRMLRIFGFVRMLRISDLSMRLLDRNFGSQLMPLLELPGLVMFLSMVNHLVGCSWYYIGKTAPSDTGFRWLDIPIGGLNVDTYREQPIMYQWSTAVHWSLTQMTPGSMSVQPENSVERIFNIVCLILGTIFFSSIVSRLSVKLVQFHEMRSRSARTINSLSNYLRRSDVHTALIVMAVKQLQDRICTQEHDASFDAQVFEMLPEKTQMAIHYEMHRKYMIHPLLMWWDVMDNSAMRLACHQSMRFLFFGDQDTLFYANAEGTAAYVLVGGSLTYRQDPTSCSHVTAEIEVKVDPMTMLAEPVLWLMWSHVGFAESQQQSQVLAIDAQDLKRCLDYSKACGFVFHEYAAAFCRRVTKLPKSRPPSDLASSLPLFEEILPSTSSELRELVGLAAFRRLPKPSRVRLIKLFAEDVSSNTAILMLTSAGQIERFVVTTGLKLRRGDGRFLVFLSTFGLGTWTPGLLLPTGRFHEGDTSLDVVHNILMGWLGPFAQEVSLSNEPPTSARSTSVTSSGLQTTSICVIHEAVLSVNSLDLPVNHCGVEIPSLELPSCRVRFEDPFILAKPADDSAHGRSLLMTADSSVSAEDFKYALCAWVHDLDFEVLSGDVGQSRLRTHLEDVPIAEKLSQEAATTWERLTSIDADGDVCQGNDDCERKAL